MVAAGIADRIEIQVSFVIGVADRMSVCVETYGTEKIDRQKIKELIDKYFDLRPAAIIKYLDLRRPIYRQHSGITGTLARTDIDLPWEKTDKAEMLKKRAFGK
jgi:S-adenosylmethionine synthetase